MSPWWGLSSRYADNHLLGGSPTAFPLCSPGERDLLSLPALVRHQPYCIRAPHLTPFNPYHLLTDPKSKYKHMGS